MVEYTQPVIEKSQGPLIRILGHSLKYAGIVTAVTAVAGSDGYSPGTAFAGLVLYVGGEILRSATDKGDSEVERVKQESKLEGQLRA